MKNYLLIYSPIKDMVVLTWCNPNISHIHIICPTLGVRQCIDIYFMLC